MSSGLVSNSLVSTPKDWKKTWAMILPAIAPVSPPPPPLQYKFSSLPHSLALFPDPHLSSLILTIIRCSVFNN